MAAKKKINGAKIAMVALGIGAIGGIAYLAISHAKGSASVTEDGTSNTDVKNPIKRAILKRKAAKAIAAKTNASTTDSTVTNTAPASFVPKDLAKTLSEASSDGNLPGVLAALKQMRNTSDYWLVDNEYKKLKYFGNRTIVTDLLYYSFRTDEKAKTAIRNELTRIGLKQDPVTQKWSLEGFSTSNDLITMKDSYVLDSRGNTILVKKNTILGEELSIANGMTRFRSVDGAVNTVPTRDVRFV